MAHEPFLLKLAQHGELLLCGNLGIYSVELPQIDPVQLQPLQAGLELAAKEFRPSILHPTVWPGALQAALGGDNQARIGVESLRDQLFGNVRSIGIGGVKEGYSQLDGPLEHADGFVAVLGWSPNTFAGQAHGAESHAVHGEIATQSEGAGRGSGDGSGVRVAHEKHPVEGSSRE